MYGQGVFHLFLAIAVSAVLSLATPSGALAENNERPGARWGHSFVYFPPQDNFVLFGGASERRVYTDEMWIWENGVWRRVDVETPTARGFMAAAYHPERQTILFHGGRDNDGNTLSELWEWDGEGWREIDSDSPFQSDHHAMTFVPALEGVLVFGGWTGQEVSQESWVWDGSWRRLAGNSDDPPPRSAFGMAFNEDKNRVELFGGLWINGQYADTWAWESGEWTRLSGPYDNSSLDHHAMFYDHASRNTLIFGGKDYRYTMRRETRIVREAGIVDVYAAEGPPARHSSAIAVDTKRQRAVLFGGKKYVGEEQIPLGDLWAWRAGVWEELP